LRLAVDDPPLAAIGVDESDAEQVVPLGMEAVQVKIGASVVPVQLLTIDKRKTDLKTRRIEDDVDRLFRAIDEPHPVACQALDVRLDREVAVADLVVQS